MVSAGGADDLLGMRLGEFELLEPIGSGGMSTVYKAYQRSMDRFVAVKVLPPQTAKDPVLLKRFYREARAAAKLNHPNVVQAIAAGEQSGLHYYVMEYVEGETLAERVARSGPLPEQEAKRIVAAVADALAAAHALGLVHRDVKPENILILPDYRVKLADLGLVKWLGEELNLTVAGRGLGTINYMAPEQFRDAKHADARCDIYSLGLTLYFALTGKVPWLGLDLKQIYKAKRAGDLPDVRKLNPSVSAETAEIIRRATDPEPRRRYQSCSELAEQLIGRSGSSGTARQSAAASADLLETRPEVQVDRPSSARQQGASVPADMWFVRFTDSSGQRRQVRLRTHEVRQGIRSGRLTDTMRVAKSERGPWLHVSAFEEFRDVVAQLSRDPFETKVESELRRTVEQLHEEASQPSKGNWRWLLVCLSLLAAAIAIIAAAVML